MADGRAAGGFSTPGEQKGVKKGTKVEGRLLKPVNITKTPGLLVSYRFFYIWLEKKDPCWPNVTDCNKALEFVECHQQQGDLKSSQQIKSTTSRKLYNLLEHDELIRHNSLSSFLPLFTTSCKWWENRMISVKLGPFKWHKD